MKDHPVIDTPYTWYYYRGQSPIRINYVARLKGVNTKPHTDPFTYLELGCGNGVTANALAASFPKGVFVAADMNPEHINNAVRLADKGGLSNIRFINGDSPSVGAGNRSAAWQNALPLGGDTFDAGD